MGGTPKYGQWRNPSDMSQGITYGEYQPRSLVNAPVTTGGAGASIQSAINQTVRVPQPAPTSTPPAARPSVATTSASRTGRRLAPENDPFGTTGTSLLARNRTWYI